MSSPLQGPLPLPGRGPLVKWCFPSAVAAPEAAVHDVDSQTPPRPTESGGGQGRACSSLPPPPPAGDSDAHKLGRLSHPSTSLWAAVSKHPSLRPPRNLEVWKSVQPSLVRRTLQMMLPYHQDREGVS